LTTEARAGLRLKVLATLVVAMFAALTTRLWFLQVLAAEQYREDATNNAVRLVEHPAQRGRIKDASGEVLVEDRLTLVLTVNRQEAGERIEDVLFRLSQLLDVPAAELGEALDDPNFYSFSPIPVAVDVPKRVVFFVREHDEDFKGVEIVELPVRTYPLGASAAHVLGYLGQISPEKLTDPAFADYRAGDLVGVAGVESVYEHELVGTHGITKYLVNSLGENIGTIGSQPAQRGNDVFLTLDADLQTLAEDSLVDGIRRARTIFDQDSGQNLIADAGAVVVMNPDTGGIEAMVSYPAFHPSLFTRRMTQSEVDRRFGEGTGAPLLNRAIQGQYPPGSTYKPWIAVSGLQRSRVATDQSYSCPATWITPFNQDDPNAQIFPFVNWTSANLGFMNMATALARSCDTIFYPLGYSYWDDYFVNDDEEARGVVSREPLQHDLTAMGFGSLTNVDLPGEEEGRVPTAEWKRGIHEEFPESFPEGEWFPGDLILMSIGQGDTLVTPLQMAASFSGLMREDGRVCTPHVLDRVIDAESGAEVRRYDPTCRRMPFEPEHLTYVRNALTGTVRGNGTAAGAFSGFPFEQVWVAGKTGTAEVDPKQDYSWFAAMTESQGERHVVVVLVEQGGHGSTTAAPIARHIIEGMYGLEFSTPIGVTVTD
jgi:penicillin-binding protein 2